MLATQQLRRGEGEYSTPDARRKERVLTSGRTKALRTGVKIEHIGAEYVVLQDTVLDAYVRLIEAENRGSEAGNE